MAYGSKVKKKTVLMKMKSNQDGGAYAAKDPAAPAKELINNQSKVAKAGCKLKQISNGSKIAKKGNPYGH